MYDAYTRIFTRLGLRVPRGRGRHRRDRRHRVARVPGARRLGRGRDRLLPAIATTRPTSSRPRRSRRRARARRRAEPMQKVADARQAHVRGRRRSSSSCRSSRRSSAWSMHRAGPACRCCCVRGDHMLNEVKIGKVPGLEALPLRDRRRDRRGDRLPARLSRPGRHSAGMRADRRPHGRGDERLRLRRQRGGLPPARRELRPRLPRARRRRRHPQRRRRRPVARRQGHARDRARHRGRPRVPAGHRLLEDDGRNLSRREGQVAARWRWAATASASRASSPPPSSRTTTTRASSGPSRWRRSRCAIAPIGYDRSEAVQAPPTSCYARAAGAGHRRAPRRSRRAPRRAVRRPGADRHPASHR